MKTISIHPDDIEIGERHRALSSDAVQRLAGSMKDIGLKQPISIRVVDMMIIDGQEVEGVPVLVAGAHRLAAAKRLGWPEIDCIEVDDDALQAELWEIDENLMRAELSPAQQAEHLSRRKDVWEALSAQIASKPTGGRPAGFASETAKATGVHKATINRDLARAEALGPDLRIIAGTSLDKGVEMDALARMTPEQRAPIVAAAASGQQVSARPVKPDHEVILAQANAIISAWNRACPEARDMALAEIDGPVFDRTAVAR